MKRKSSICSLLSITQQEAAMLFGVSRSLWSLYELGKRDLPLSASQFLAEMLAYMQADEATDKQAQPTAHHATPGQLEYLLHENEYQQKLTQRKITAAIKKQEAQIRLRKLHDFLAQRENGKQTQSGIHQMIAAKASQANDAAVSTMLTEQHHHQEVLELESAMLKSKLQILRMEVEDPKNENDF